MEDIAGVALEYPVARSAAKALEDDQEFRWLAALVTGRRRFPVRCTLRRIGHSNSPPRIVRKSGGGRKFPVFKIGHREIQNQPTAALKPLGHEFIRIEIEGNTLRLTKAKRR